MKTSDSTQRDRRQIDWALQTPETAIKTLDAWRRPKTTAIVFIEASDDT